MISLTCNKNPELVLERFLAPVEKMIQGVGIQDVDLIKELKRTKQRVLKYSSEGYCAHF